MAPAPAQILWGPQGPLEPFEGARTAEQPGPSSSPLTTIPTAPAARKEEPRGGKDRGGGSCPSNMGEHFATMLKGAETSTDGQHRQCTYRLDANTGDPVVFCFNPNGTTSRFLFDKKGCHFENGLTAQTHSSSDMRQCSQIMMGCFAQIARSPGGLGGQ